RPLFLPANYGREALFQYLQAASVGLFGHSDWALRVPASACGIATLPLSYLLVRRLYGPRVALLTCAWLAISLWHVMYSRIVRRSFFRRALPAFVVTGLVTILVFAPEAWYFLRHPDDFVVRAREVSVLNPSLNQGDSTATLEYAAVRTLGMFSFLGDEQPDR